jgi:hypothetical protein
MDLFTSVSDALPETADIPPETVDICSAENFSSGAKNHCQQFWCEAVPQLVTDLNAPYNCSCRDRPKTGSNCGQDTGVGEVAIRVFGWHQSVPDTIQQQLLSKWASFEGDNAACHMGVKEPLSDAVLQEWSSGDIVIKDVSQLNAFFHSSTFDNLNRQCERQALCFCGGELKCQAQPTWSEWAPFQFGGRRLQMSSPTVPIGERAKVRVVFGMEVTDEVVLIGGASSDEIWSFLPDFRLDDPWTQRNLYHFCTNTPQAAKVAKVWCWMKDFRTFAKQEVGHFPIRDKAEFDSLSTQFIASDSYGTRGYRYIWHINGEIKALYDSYEIDVKSNVGASQALELKKVWDVYLARFNAMSDVTKKTGRGAFHVSKLWVKAESNALLMETTLTTVVILLVLAFVGMICFTWSLVLSLYTVLSTIMVVVSLLFFVTVVAAWPLGLIEVIAFIYFVGYAVTYSLHIAHKYACDEAADCVFDDEDINEENESAKIRFKRTAFAVSSIGGAAVGSAATTAGASFFLCFSTLTIFNRLGNMCLVVTVMSIVCAMGPLPGALLSFGPLNPGYFGPTHSLGDTIANRLTSQQREQE